MTKTKPLTRRIVCSNCGKPFHGLTACDITTLDAQRFEALQSFLDSYDARLISSWHNAEWKGRELRLYVVTGYQLIVVIDANGWEVFRPASADDSISVTLAALAEFLGPKPGDGSEATH